MCTETWRGAGVARSPSHESVTTDLSLFSVSSAASDARVLRMLACKVRSGQGPDPSIRVASPNPDGKASKSDARVLRMLACKAGQGPDPSIRVASPNPDGKASKSSAALPLASGESGDACREVLAGCAALCAQLGLRRSFSAADVCQVHASPPPRSATSEVGLCAALEALTMNAASRSCSTTTTQKTGVKWKLFQLQSDECASRSATSEVGLCAALEALTMNAASRSCSTWVAVGGSQLPSPQRAHPSHLTPRPQPSDNKKVRQNYIKKRLLTTYRALERMSQSEFNLDRLEQAAAASAAGRSTGNCLAAPPARPNTRLLHPETAHLVLTAADLERERGRPLSKYERNMMIFNWLHTLDEVKHSKFRPYDAAYSRERSHPPQKKHHMFGKRCFQEQPTTNLEPLTRTPSVVKYECPEQTYHHDLQMHNNMVTKELSFPSTQHQASWCAERWTGPARAGAARGD
ncbi:hypothetical protein RR46_05429 [Papilio xuthus]|uniref:Uncharacterized protein n=1 Tax=Papilio xuthus TaxID=66420 RepID=A0A194Q774_PAPXU|nr:hypothetical protein RR46_05429 [Papilio xuthus]